MCRPVRRVPLDEHTTNTTNSSNKIRAARKIVKKYRKREEKRELEKLRQLLPTSPSQTTSKTGGPVAAGKKLRKKEVIDETISLIVSLEKQLMEKILRQGQVPTQLSHTGLHTNNLSLDALRSAMACVMPSRSPPSSQVIGSSPSTILSGMSPLLSRGPQ